MQFLTDQAREDALKEYEKQQEMWRKQREKDMVSLMEQIQSNDKRTTTVLIYSHMLNPNVQAWFLEGMYPYDYAVKYGLNNVQAAIEEHDFGYKSVTKGN